MVKSVRIQRNGKSKIARVLDKNDRDFYKEVFAKTAEKFGKRSRAFKTITNGISADNVTGSQFFWNTNLGLYLPKSQRVISLEDAEAINDRNESFFEDSFYDKNFPEIILRTETPSWEENKYVLKDLVKQVKREKLEFSSENPLRLSGLELAEDGNARNIYGLFLKIGDNAKAINDKRFVHSNYTGRRIQFGKKKESIHTKKEGLSRFGIIRGGALCACSGDLMVSNNYGRTIIIESINEEK